MKYAKFVVIGIVFLLLFGCGGQIPNNYNITNQTNETNQTNDTLPQSDVSEQVLSQLIANATGANYTITYNVTTIGLPGYGLLNWSMVHYVKRPNIRMDFENLEQTDVPMTSSFRLGENKYWCLKNRINDEWMVCDVGVSSYDEILGDANGIMALRIFETNYEHCLLLYVENREFVGENATCFAFLCGDLRRYSEMCYTRDGILVYYRDSDPLSSQLFNHEWVATNLSREVNDSVFELPLPPREN